MFGRKNDLVQNMQPPQVVVISYFMLARLRRSMVSHKWGMLIVDESHNLRCTLKKAECEEVCICFPVDVRKCWNKNLKGMMILVTSCPQWLCMDAPI